MATNIVEVGHVVVSHEGTILRADAGFSAIMRTPGPALVGRGLLEITVPEDRALCADYMKTLRTTRRPFRVAKRLLRDDGSAIWVDKTVAIADFGDGSDDTPPLIVVTAVPIADPQRLEDPARLLGMALFLRETRRAQQLVFPLEGGGDVAWGILIAAYIAEAQGQALSLDTLAEQSGIAKQIAQRWLRVLMADDLIEAERPDGNHYRMTGSAHARFETYLANRIVKASSFDGNC